MTGRDKEWCLNQPTSPSVDLSISEIAGFGKQNIGWFNT